MQAVDSNSGHAAHVQAAGGALLSSGIRRYQRYPMAIAAEDVQGAPDALFDLLVLRKC